MTNTDLAVKYDISLDIAKRLDKEPGRIFVKTFNIYNEFNPQDEELIRMNKFLAKHPEYEKVHFHQQGPCSNWGYDIWRKETQEEYEIRIQKEIKKWTKFFKKYYGSKWYKLSQKILTQIDK